MEENKEFVNETDYKSLWQYCNKKRDEAEKLAADRMDQIEDLERQLAEAKRSVTDAEYERESMGRTIDRLRGEISGLQYAIRYYMAGDPA